MPPDSEVLEIARLLRLAGREVKKKRDSNAASLGLTSSQADALAFVIANPGCSISDLRNALESSHQAAAAIVDRMRDAGLIETSVSEQDARVRILTPTGKGELVYGEFVDMGVDVNGNLLDGISEDDAGELRSMLSRMLDNLRRRLPGTRACGTL
ncbi:MAG: MarR family winged helix-turn-helix transcriptional regulator [Thermoplasmata archaeon]|nr:MarR family winged helix-turn-helix transcriptional regulator [Thermoplasmata archaeon]